MFYIYYMHIKDAKIDGTVVPAAMGDGNVEKVVKNFIEKGGNSFMQLSVPQAVIKFRQGFGRLVRRGDDRGVVVVLDRRIVEKRYGSIFTNSIPKTRRMYSPMSSIIETVRNFIVNN